MWMLGLLGNIEKFFYGWNISDCGYRSVGMGFGFVKGYISDNIWFFIFDWGVYLYDWKGFMV